MDVARIRRRHRLTQAALAKLLGAHPMTVSKWERGLLQPNGHQRVLLQLLGGTAGERTLQPLRALAAHLNTAFLDATEIHGMKLSASNQLKGTITSIDEGPVTSRVVLEIAPHVQIVSLITTASVRRLKLAPGRRAVAIIKATEVILGTK